MEYIIFFREDFRVRMIYFSISIIVGGKFGRGDIFLGIRVLIREEEELLGLGF